MALTLYYHILSQPARAVLALMNLGRIEFDGKVVNLFNGQTRSAEYLKINPFGGVPFIVHEGLHLSESNAILTHLCQYFSDDLKHYYGGNANERALINQYLSWYQGTYRPVLLRPLRLKLVTWKTNKPYSLKQLGQSEKKVNQTLDFLENRLSVDSPYLVGNHLSIADLLLYHQTTNVDYYGLNLNKWSKLEKWYKTVQSNKVVNDIHVSFEKESQGIKNIFSNLKHVE